MFKLGIKVHDKQHQPGCPECNPGAAEIGGRVCTCLEEAYAEGLKRWQQACPCCFGDNHPEGLEAAVAAALQ